jgi:hypothetical protein
MTKIIIIGETEERKEVKKIEFTGYLSGKLDIGPKEACADPDQYKAIELICINYCNSGKDLMYAYNRDRNEGFLYLGHFNDGIV